MRENRLRAMLDAGEPTLGTRIHCAWPGVIEALGHTGAFDYVEFLAEYAPFDLHDLEGLCPRTFLAQRSVGAGFQGVLFADCRSAADARACIAAVRPETPSQRGTYGVASPSRGVHGLRRLARVCRRWSGLSLLS